MKPRLFVLTDITSCESGVREPDDAQTLVRLLHYANDFEIEGLCATSNMGHGYVRRPELIHKIIDAYEHDFPNLSKVDSAFMRPEALRKTVYAGEAVAGPEISVENCVLSGKLSDAARHLISVVDKADTQPLWVVVWGGTADLAQALHSVEQTRNASEYERFAAKLRILAIGDQDTTGKWIRERHPSVWYWMKTRSYRGVYRGGDVSCCSYEWVAKNLTNAKSAMARLYPNYDGGDIWRKTLGPVRGVKEGDTPSWLGLIPNGLHLPEMPELGGWGGRAVKVNARHYEDAVDADLQAPEDPDPRMSSVYRWRADFQADFLRRVKWAEGSGEPLQGVLKSAYEPVSLEVERTKTVCLDAADFMPTDGLCELSWMPYPALPDRCEIAGSKLTIELPQNGQIGHSSLIIRGAYGHGPQLIRYRRVLISSK